MLNPSLSPLLVPAPVRAEDRDEDLSKYGVLREAGQRDASNPPSGACHSADISLLVSPIKISTPTPALLRRLIPPLESPQFPAPTRPSFPRVSARRCCPTPGSLPRGTLSGVPRSEQDTEAAADPCTAGLWALGGGQRGLGRFGEPLREAGVSQHLPAPLQPCPCWHCHRPKHRVPPGLCLAAVAHLGVIEVADLAQVLAGHHAQTDGQALAQQPQDGGPEQHPQQLGTGGREAMGTGYRAGSASRGSPAQAGVQGREGVQSEGFPSRTLGALCLCRGPRALPAPGLGKQLPWQPLALERLRNPRRFLSPELTLNPATAPLCRSDSTLPGSR